MDNNILIAIIGCIIVIGIIGIFIGMALSRKKKKPENIIQPESKKIEPKISPAHDLINKKEGAAKNGGGIVSQKPNVVEKVKAANWTESESYEEDIKNLDVDSLFKTDPTPEALAPSQKEPKELVFSNKNLEDKPVHVPNGPQILLVDDSLVVRKYVGNLLKKHGYDIIMKVDGWEAITYLNGSLQKPELIISDIEMPNMNGFELIEAIRKEKKFNNVPIVVISAHTENHIKLMETENIQGFITKPFKDEDLLSQLNYLLNK